MSGTEIDFCRALYKHVDGNMECWPTFTTIAKNMGGRNEKTARLSFVMPRYLGYVTVIGQRAYKGEPSSLVFRLSERPHATKPVPDPGLTREEKKEWRKIHMRLAKAEAAEAWKKHLAAKPWKMPAPRSDNVRPRPREMSDRDSP